MKKYILCLLTVLVFISIKLNATGPMMLNETLTALNNPIIVGENVFFQSTVTRLNGCMEGFNLNLNFGPAANPQYLNLSVPATSNPFNMTIGPITFNMTGMFELDQSITNTSCAIQAQTGPTISIFPRSVIPTLTQWGLIIVAFFLIIFGVISLRGKVAAIAK